MNLSSTIFKSFSVAILAILAAVTFGALNTADAQSTRNIGEYNLTNSIGLKGYDPVSYFPDGGGIALEGDAKFALEFQGVTYLFATQKNLETFRLAPEKFEPSYGGWCAYAMASGSKVDIQPTVFTLHGNRLHFFVSKRAKANFDTDVASYETRADGFWRMFSGEEPRI